MAIDRFYGCCGLQRGAIVWGVLCLMVDVGKLIPCFAFLPWVEGGFTSTVLSLCVFVTVIDVITSILLIIGAVQKRRDFVLVWLVFYLAEIFATVAVLNYFYPVLILFVPFLYAWACIFVFYKSLGNGQGYCTDLDEPLTVAL